MARGVKTPANKPAAPAAAKKTAAKTAPPATDNLANVTSAAQPAAPAAATQDIVQQPAVNLEVQTQVASPTIIVKDSTVVNTDVRELVTENIGAAHINHDGKSVTTTLDEIGFQQGVDMVGFDEKAEQLAFLEEKMVINIMETTDKNAEKFVYVAVNGEGAGHLGLPYLPRGVDVTVKRKHVEKLLRSRPSSYESQEYVAENGERKIRYPETAALMYPFQVISDPSPDKGRAWMKQILAERA